MKLASSSWESGSASSTRAVHRLSEGLCQVEQAEREAAHHVVRRDLPELVARVAQPRGELAPDERVGLRVGLEELHERRRAQRERLDLLERRHGAEPRRAVDGGQLADELAGAAQGDDHLPAVGRHRDDLDPPREQDEHRARLVALVEQRGVAGEPPPGCRGGQVSSVRWRQQVEEASDSGAWRHVAILRLGGCRAARLFACPSAQFRTTQRGAGQVPGAPFPFSPDQGVQGGSDDCSGAAAHRALEAREANRDVSGAAEGDAQCARREQDRQRVIGVVRSPS